MREKVREWLIEHNFFEYEIVRRIFGGKYYEVEFYNFFGKFTMWVDPKDIEQSRLSPRNYKILREKEYEGLF